MDELDFMMDEPVKKKTRPKKKVHQPSKSKDIVDLKELDGRVPFPKVTLSPEHDPNDDIEVHDGDADSDAPYPDTWMPPKVDTLDKVTDIPPIPKPDKTPDQIKKEVEERVAKIKEEMNKQPPLVQYRVYLGRGRNAHDILTIFNLLDFQLVLNIEESLLDKVPKHLLKCFVKEDINKRRGVVDEKS